MRVEIGLQSIAVILRGGGGPNPTGNAFFRLLRIADTSGIDMRPSDSAWRSANAQLFAVSVDDLKEAEEPSEAFDQRVQEEFARAATILAACDSDGLDKWRSRGEAADLFIGGWLANEQFDLKLPPAFLVQCARLDLPIRICTND